MESRRAFTFKDLQVWQKAFKLAIETYKLTKLLPAEERYGIASQIQRSSVSIPSNIAEGRQRKTKKEFAHFLLITDGSCAELETQLLLIQEIYPKIPTKGCLDLLLEVQKMIGGLLHSLSHSPPTPDN